MSNPSPLGRLHKVELRDIWTTEAGDFTPWLAQPENLSVLAEALGIEPLELEAQEKAVGPFRADLLCKEASTATWVLVENQLERTDHTHLGQLLTYASGLQAVTIVWIAGRFTEEHRSTLDWLNKITDESFRFFGLEVELWRIGDSPAAPKFNVVSKPNDWSRSVAQAARSIDEQAYSDTRQLQREYWEALNVVLNELKGPVPGSRKPQPAQWINYAIVRTHFQLAAVMNRPNKLVRAELYLSGPNAKPHFYLLHAQRGQVERELGYALVWDELPDGGDSRISISLPEADVHARADWPRQLRWIAQRLSDLHRVFSQRVRLLRADDWRPVAPSADLSEPG